MHQPTIAVIGDAILDEYLQGDVSRISPEAPVPVHLVKATIHRPGGAANAALNIQTVGAKAKLFSIVGEDEAGRKLRNLLKESGIDESGVVMLNDRPTIRKTRVTAGIQQLIRVDWEKPIEVKAKVVQLLLENLRKSQWDGLLISDYGKGLLSDFFLKGAIEIANERKAPIVVDPKRKDFSCYLGATVITPNKKEACMAIDMDPDSSMSGEEIAKALSMRYRFQNVLVTLGSHGMVLAAREKGLSGEVVMTSLKAVAREVYDVSGAGDTVAALIAVSLGCQTPIHQALHLANTAAAIVVGKVGTQPVFKDELAKALNASMVKNPRRSKILDRGDIADLFETKVMNLKQRRQKVVFTNGCFDILHAGHVSYLEEAKSKGDVLVVGVNSDLSVRRLKGPTRPIITLQDRLAVLAALECVDYVIPFDEDTPEDLIKLIIPNILVKGADYRTDVEAGHRQGIVGADFVKANGGDVLTIPLVPGVSTTDIIKKICTLPN